jgi:hypothetical protein
MDQAFHKLLDTDANGGKYTFGIGLCSYEEKLLIQNEKEPNVINFLPNDLLDSLENSTILRGLHWFCCWKFLYLEEASVKLALGK